MRDMTDTQVVAHLRRWAASPPQDQFAWPTDACGSRQHMRFVRYRNTNYQRFRTEPYLELVREYADLLEAGQIPPYVRTPSPLERRMMGEGV